MFIIILLLFTKISCEWIEISQNYYRQEQPRLKYKVKFEDVTEASYKHGNQSLSPHGKRGTVDKLPSVGNVRRVPYASVKSPSIRPSMGTKLLETQIKKRLENSERSSLDNRDNMQKVLVLDEDKYKNSTITGNINFNNPDTRFKVDNGVTTFNPKIENDVTVEVPEQSLNIEHFPTESTLDSLIMNHFNSFNNMEHKSLDHLNVAQEMETHKGFNYTRSNDSANRQENSMKAIWNVIKVVADTISKHSRKGFKSKLRFLENLKATILTSIENHIEAVWPDDGIPRRVSRTAESRGHVEIPSSEGALMTISFLTFAVFLIKLVLQVIHAYKQKTMMVTPAVVAAVGRATAALKQFQRH